MATANTKDVFREVIGRRIVGVYTEPDSTNENTVTVLVFDDRTGLALNGNGAHWNVSADEVARRVGERRRELEALQRDLQDVMRSEGALEAQA